jgi:hypothetical protein
MQKSDDKDKLEEKIQDDPINVDQTSDEFKIYVKAREMQTKILKELASMIEDLENKFKHQGPK